MAAQLPEELNPYWFNSELIEEFVRQRTSGNPVAWPVIRIELFLENRDELQKLCGAINTDLPTNACPGISMTVLPDPAYSEDLDEWAKKRLAALASSVLLDRLAVFR